MIVWWHDNYVLVRKNMLGNEHGVQSVRWLGERLSAHIIVIYKSVFYFRCYRTRNVNDNIREAKG